MAKKPAPKKQAAPKKSAGYRAESGKGGGNKKPSKKPSGYKGGNSKPKKNPPKKSGQGGGGGNNFPSIEDYLAADPYYQAGLSDLMLGMDQFGIQNDAAQGDIESLFKLTLERMAKERDRSLIDIKDDFGARGLVNSGLYTKGVSDYNQEYSDRVFDLNRDRDIQLRNLGFDSANMQGLNQSKQDELRLDAIRRRAEELASMVGSGVPKPGGGGKKPGTKVDRTPGFNMGAWGGYYNNYMNNKPKASVAKPIAKPKSSSIRNPKRPGFGSISSGFKKYGR